MIIHSKSKDTAQKQGPGSQKRESQFKNQWKICFTNFQRHFAQIKDDSEEKLNEEQRQVKCFQKDILKRSENLKLFTKVQNWIKKEKINSKKTFFKAIQSLDKEMIQFIYASLYVFLEQLYYRNVISKIYEHKSIQQNEELLRKFLISNNGEQFPYPHETQQQSSFNLNLSNNSIQQQNQQQMNQIQQQQQQANINDKQSSFLQDQITIKQEFNQDIEEEQKIDFDNCDNENNTNTTSNNNNKIQNSMSRSRQNNSTRNNKKGKKAQQKQLKQFIDRFIDESKKVGSNYTIEQENGDYFFKYKIDASKKGTYEIKIPLTKETIMQFDQESIQDSFLSDSQQSSQQQSNINQPQSSFLNNTNNNDQNEYQQQSKNSQFLNSFNSKKNIQYKVKVLNKEQNAIEKIYNQEDIDKYSLILPQKEDKSFFFSENQQLSLKQQSGLQFESFHLSCCSDYKEGENINKINDANTSNNSFQQKRRSSRKLNQSCINNLGQNDKINNNKQNSIINEKISLISSRPDSEISQENQIILTNKVPESTEEIQTQKLEKLHLKQQLGHIQQQQQQQQESQQQKSRKPSLEIYNNNNNISNNNFPYYNDQNQIQNNQLLQDQQQQQYQEASYFLEQSNNNININNISNNGIISDNNPCQSCQTQQNILCNCNGQFNQQEMLNKDNISSIAPCDSRKWSEEFNF